MNKNWSDLNRDGRRLDRLIKMCEKMILSELKKPIIEHERVWGYVDRVDKLTKNKSNVVEIITGVKKILRKLEKQSIER